MKVQNWRVALVAIALAGVSMMACVEQQPSIVMTGSSIGEYDAEARSCSYNLDLSDTQQIATAGFVDLKDLLANGQPIALPSSLEEDAVYGPPGVFNFTAIYENRLVDSRSVGSESSGGSGGGFQNLTNDQSDVMITSATVSFPASSNTFNIDGNVVSFATRSGDEVERERLFSMLVASGSGTAMTHIPLINGPREAEDFRAFLSQVPASEPLTFIAEIQLKGKTLSGKKVESNLFEFPVQVCADCGRSSMAMCTL